MQTTNHNTPDDDSVNFKKLASVFFVCSLISFLASWYYSGDAKLELQTTTNPSQQAEIGPLIVKNDSTPYEFTVTSGLQHQSWAFIEAEVLDKNKQYLFSFGKDMWYESGHDSEGGWTENNNEYSIDITFPKAGTYYFRIKSEANKMPSGIKIKIARSKGSALPHFWFGMLTLIIGVVLNQIQKRKDNNARGNF